MKNVMYEIHVDVYLPSPLPIYSRTTGWIEDGDGGTGSPENGRRPFRLTNILFAATQATGVSERTD